VRLANLRCLGRWEVARLPIVARILRFSPPRVVDPPVSVTIRTRLRLSPRDAAVLSDLGQVVARARGRDLAERCRLGTSHTKEDFARRKRSLTAEMSARWAGTITRGNNDQWLLARRAQRAHLADLEQAMSQITYRLSLPAGSKEGRVAGYGSQGQRAAKQGRLQILRARHEQVQRDYSAGRVHVTQGGKDRLRQRLHLEDSSAESQWQRDWVNARRRIEADGESGKKFGNQTIRVSPDGMVLIKLPPALAERWSEACDEHGRYQLSTTATFHYRADKWLDQVLEYRAIGYRISFEGDRCYIAASFTPPAHDSIQVSPGTMYGIDHNVDHFAGWLIDRHGNPVGRPDRFPIDNSGSVPRRDAQVRHAVSQIIRRAKALGAVAIAIEDLDFETQREELGWGGSRGRGFRRIVSGMPTANFAVRLAAMAGRAGLPVVAVDPRYTSQWGARYWQRPTCTTRHETSRHEAAAIVIGRRALGLGARRRIEKTTPRRRTEATGPGPDGVEIHPSARAQHQSRGATRPSPSRRRPSARRSAGGNSASAHPAEDRSRRGEREGPRPDPPATRHGSSPPSARVRSGTEGLLSLCSRCERRSRCSLQGRSGWRNRQTR
jgi:IS605 OrfB family transposase